MTKNRNYYSYLEGWLSIFVNTLLFVLKYWAGIVSGSVALLADAWHTLSDSVSSVIVLVGTKMSNKPADEEHPFGHGRNELIASVFIGFLLGLIAFEFGKEAIQKLIHKDSVQFGTLAIVVTIVSILLKEALAQVAFWTARKSDNKALKADAWHHRTDAISSVIILAGIFVGKYFWWIDSLLGILVALIIAYTAFQIISDAIKSILGETPDAKLVEKIKHISNREAVCDVNVHHIHIHNYIRHKELTFHIRLPQELNVDRAHQISTKIEQALREELHLEATIHIEPR